MDTYRRQEQNEIILLTLWSSIFVTIYTIPCD